MVLKIHTSSLMRAWRKHRINEQKTTKFANSIYKVVRFIPATFGVVTLQCCYIHICRLYKTLRLNSS